MIRILSSKNAAALGLGKGYDWVEIIKPGHKIPVGQKPKADDQVYLDISGLSQAELKKALGPLKKSSAFWGIIDPKDATADPASFFFQGASDYIGSAIVKKGLCKKRFAEALSWAASKRITESGNASKKDTGNKKKTQKLLAGKFGGWKSIHTGTTNPFFFLFVSFSQKIDYRSMLGEGAFLIIRNRLREVLLQNLHRAEALLWMESEESSLFLVPPMEANGKAAVEAVLKMLMNSRLIGIEALGLATTFELTFALHYGTTTYNAPGKTGAVVSEAVNYIFHLGTRASETGRLTFSDDVPEAAFPKALLDLFTPAGSFEGIPISHSKRFVHK